MRALLRSLFVVLCLAYVAGWPGAALQSLDAGTATELAIDSSNREDVRDVAVRAADHAALEGNRKGVLIVRVVSGSGEIVQGARVLVASPVLWPARAVETPADGIVRIDGLDDGSYAIKATMGSRVSTTELEIAVSHAEETNIELRLEQGIFVAARVVEAATDEPIDKARVTLAEAGLSPFPISGLTDKAGRIELGPIARGTSTLSVSADGFVTKPATHVGDNPTTEVKIALVRGGTLTGRVVDVRGFPVEGATIRVVGTDVSGMPIDEDPQLSSFRDAHFTMALAGPRPLLSAGELGVMPGHLPDTPHGNTIGSSSTTHVAGALDALAHVNAEPWITARDGTFQASPVTPGRVRVFVHHPQYIEAMSDAVTLTSDGEATINVVLASGGTLEGRVVDTHGRPIEGAQVTVLATRGSFEQITRTGTDGSFELEAVPEDLMVLVSRDDDVTHIASRAEIRVPDGERKSMEIVLPDARDPLSVRITGVHGDPVDAAQISAVSLEAGEALRTTVFTDDRGEANLAAAKGLALRVEVRAAGYGVQVITTTRDTDKLEIALATAESITGEVRANRRESIEGAEVVLHTKNGVYHARTDKDGIFTMGDLSPGRARLRIRAKGRAPLDRHIVVEDRGGRQPTDIGKFELAEEGIVEGVVMDAKGDPVPGARVAKDSVPTYLPSAVVPSDMAVCDAHGLFRLGELPEGNVVLEAYSPDVGRTRMAGVRVIAGRTTDGVKITLPADGERVDEPFATGGVAVTLGETAAEPAGSEVVVVSVAEGSEAERAGIVPNDILVEVGGVAPSGIADARARLSGPLHDDVVVKVRRREHVVTLRITREPVRR
ncbi:MAG: carboxypeptidase regulatory-like domain-containing protein [Polyangiaceae bacterium]|nr:carboxypeptidase regulatory-like domain-containing protein [Polyangiaceae bacterium]